MFPEVDNQDLARSAVISPSAAKTLAPHVPVAAYHLEPGSHSFWRGIHGYRCRLARRTGLTALFRRNYFRDHLKAEPSEDTTRVCALQRTWCHSLGASRSCTRQLGPAASSFTSCLTLARFRLKIRPEMSGA